MSTRRTHADSNPEVPLIRAIGTRLAAAAVLVGVIAHTAHAQRRPAPTTASKANAPAPEGNGGKTNFTLFAGIATGDAYDLGFAVQGSFRIPLPTVPIAIRIDPYLARHGGGSSYDVGSSTLSDATLTLLGVAGDAEYTFKTTGSQVEPYVLAGLGMYHGSGGGGEGSTDLGLGIGGGIRYMKRWAAEAQFKSINGFSTIPLMVGYHF